MQTWYLILKLHQNEIATLTKCTNHPAKFGGHRHSFSGDMFLVVEEQYFTCSCLTPALLFISQAHGMKIHGMWSENTWNVSKAAAEEKYRNVSQPKKNKKAKCKAFCVTQKCNEAMIYLALLSLFYWFFKKQKTFRCD